MDCGSQEGRDKSREIFLQLKTYSQFLDTWVEFYSNKMCIPTYFAGFVGGEDNRHATRKMGEKFQQITRYGLIPFSFQTNNLKDGQKAYVNLYATEKVSIIITEYINRYPGFAAFYQDVNGESCINGLYVTYDPDKEQRKKTMKTGVFFGNPFTHLGTKSDDMDIIGEWLVPPLSTILTSDNFKEVTLFDTIPTEKSDRILDLLLNALRDNSNVVNNEKQRLDNL